jgi:hypothetical protein
MISDDLLMYLLAQVILLAINLLGFRIPLMSFMGIIGSIILVVPTLDAFGEYYLISLILILVNIVLPTMSIFRYRGGE